MLEYLVTSKTRRKLLQLLWRDGVSGTVSDLADKAGVAFAGAHKELSAMAKAGVATAEWTGGRREFSANLKHPMAKSLRQLVNDRETERNSVDVDMTGLRGNLAFLGLPVNARKVSPKPGSKLEALLAHAADLAQVDASVARTLPLLFFKYRDQVDFDVLKQESRKLGNKQQVGFFLELAGLLGGSTRLKRASHRFLDKRYSVPRSLFRNQTTLAEQVAETRTPELAKKWGFRMNMPLDAFKVVFDKFVNETVST